MFVVSVLSNRENLIIPFQCQLEFSAQILVDETTEVVECLFGFGKEYPVVGVNNALDSLFLVDFVDEVRENQICEILTEVIPDRERATLTDFLRVERVRKTVHAVDYLVEQGECVFALYLTTNNPFCDDVNDRRVKFLDVDFQAVTAVLFVPENLFHTFHCSVDSSTLYATVCVIWEHF